MYRVQVHYENNRHLHSEVMDALLSSIMNQSLSPTVSGRYGNAYHTPVHLVWPALALNPPLQLLHMAAPCLVQAAPVLGEPFEQLHLLAEGHTKMHNMCVCVCVCVVGCDKYKPRFMF